MAPCRVVSALHRWVRGPLFTPLAILQLLSSLSVWGLSQASPSQQLSRSRILTVIPHEPAFFIRGSLLVLINSNVCFVAEGT